MNLSCFKAYDIRGRISDQLNDDIIYRIGRAYAQYLEPVMVVIGYDIRPDSCRFSEILTRSLNDAGVNVTNIGLCGTEEIYFQTFNRQADGGIMITASHNPMDYNGLKLVRDESKPISGDTGLLAIKELAENGQFTIQESRGSLDTNTDKSDYIAHLLEYLHTVQLQPLRIVVNAGNGCAGPIIDLLEPFLPFEFIKVHHEPNSRFPNGIPNPLLPENRASTANAVITHKADLGLAWDGDFDRCFFFDENGRFIEGYYLVGLLAEQLLAIHPESKIIHDPRLTWNTIEQVQKSGGQAVLSKTGHAFIKERMRAENAIYGGEMSAHHYFRDFAYCDSGMIPWLLIAGLISTSGLSMAKLVDQRIAAYPCSGEINFVVQNVNSALTRIESHFSAHSPQIDRTDGLSLEFSQWRLNLRGSNTEPLLRLNVESRADEALVHAKVKEITALISGL